MRPVLPALITAGLLLALPCAGFAAAPAAPAAPAEYAYGAAPLQKLDFWRAGASQPVPLIVFVHGGGWKRGDKSNATGMEKVTHWGAAGYAFASINYRLVPDATIEQEAADVAASIAWLRAHAATMGIDPSRIVLMGHSAGAHLVALIGTDPQYLAAAGMALSDVRGVIAMDGAAYDVARQIGAAGPLMRRTYAEAFGSDPARQRALSPTLQAAAPNAPAFLLIHIDRDDGRTQTEALGAALAQAGTPAQVEGVGGTGLRGHMDLNTGLGSAGAPATALVDAWLAKVVPR